MAVQQMETDEHVEQMEMTAHGLFTEFTADLTMTLSSSCTELATRLWGLELIKDQLYDNIIDKAGVATTNHDQVRLLLNTVFKHLKEEDSPEKRKARWDGLIKALSTEQIWIDSIVPKLEQDLLKEKANQNPKAESSALRKNINSTADIVAGGLLMFSAHLEANGVITSDERQKCTDPNNGHELTYTQKLLDEVGKGIKMNEKVLDDLLNIMTDDIGGPAKFLAQNIKGRRKHDIN